MQVGVLSDVGLVRKSNEDSYFVAPPHLFIVADGMGGHEAGEVASELAVNTIREYFQKKGIDRRPVDRQLQEAIMTANTKIFQTASGQRECAGMGTTVTAVYIVGGWLYWGHVGDSRAYLIRNGRIRLLTSDHSLVWELVKSGGLTAEEAMNHPHRNILTRAVGTEAEIAIDVGRERFLPADRLLLCTDGLTNLVTEAEIVLFVLGAPDAQAAVEKLVETAKDRGGYDNITVILVENEK